MEDSTINSGDFSGSGGQIVCGNSNGELFVLKIYKGELKFEVGRDEVHDLGVTAVASVEHSKHGKQAIT